MGAATSARSRANSLTVQIRIFDLDQIQVRGVRTIVNDGLAFAKPASVTVAR